MHLALFSSISPLPAPKSSSLDTSSRTFVHWRFQVHVFLLHFSAAGVWGSLLEAPISLASCQDTRQVLQSCSSSSADLLAVKCICTKPRCTACNFEQLSLTKNNVPNTCLFSPLLCVSSLPHVYTFLQPIRPSCAWKQMTSVV